MGEACSNTPFPDLDAIASVAWTLELPIDRREVLREESAALLHGLLSRCARGRGALEVSIGEGLLALSVGDRLMRLKGYAGMGDYAREELGIPASTAHKMASL